MENKHTPGPWKTDKRQATIAILDESSGVLGEVYGEVTRPSEYEANARLIAAAPDLLLACKAALLKFKHSPLDKISEAADMLRNAIAKATAKE